MIKNYIKVAWRNLWMNKTYSFINVLGLTVGMSVVMLISLWIRDELTYNKCHPSYHTLGQMMTTTSFNGEIRTGQAIVIPLADELRNNYPDDFKSISLSSWNFENIIAAGDKKFTKHGMWVEPGFPEMLGLNMIYGSISGLKDPSSVLLSSSLSRILFGNEDPLNKTVKINNNIVLNVAGVFKDLPDNATLKEADFFGAWDNYASSQEWIRQAKEQWDNHSFQMFVQLNRSGDFDNVNDKIRDIPMQHLNAAEHQEEEILIHRMSDWHLYSDFKNGKIAGGRIKFVWLFGMIGLFVLLLACINFMNLGTARSEKRAKEVGIRKTVGSRRRQLVSQFLGESVMMAMISLIISLVIVQLILPWFNQLSDKQMTILWTNPVFWICCLGFSLLTGLLAGSYPAFYLSSFDPIRVIKGTFKAGKFASYPRKIMVVMQFTVSVALIIGTIVVFRQIQHAKDRPVGYSREGLLQIMMNTPDLDGHYDAIRNELLNTGVVYEMAESSSPTTNIWSNQIGFDWEGKDPNSIPIFGIIAVTHDFGKAINWQIIQGRDFSRDFPTDSTALILNEAAVKLTGFKNPVGKTIKWDDEKFTVIGVAKDMVMESPYKPIKPSIFKLDYGWANVMNVKIRPDKSIREALAKIEPVLRKYNPGAPFDYKFTDQEYALKFESEERISKLSGFFAILAIFISCLGIFGLASFIAEQRTKEIGVRKVLGASTFNIWSLLSAEFLLLVTIAFSIAIPLSWYFMQDWLNDFDYRTTLAWWIFAIACFGALLITLITVSFQAIRAALNNPVKSLRTE